MSFEPKTKVELDPPKDDPISLDYLSKCDGMLRTLLSRPVWLAKEISIGSNPDYPTYVAIKGTIFDVSGNKAYGPDGSYKGEFSVSSMSFPSMCSRTRQYLPAKTPLVLWLNHH